jgi:hypothetical protein
LYIGLNDESCSSPTMRKIHWEFICRIMWSSYCQENDELKQ